MPRVYVEFVNMKQIGNDCKTVANNIESIRTGLYSTVSRLDWDVRFSDDIDKTAKQINRSLNNYAESLRKFYHYINDANSAYKKVESFKSDWDKNITPKAGWAGIISKINVCIPDFTRPSFPKVDFKNFLKDYWEDLGWKGLLGGSDIGKIIGIVDGFKKANGAADYLKYGAKTAKYISKASSKIKKYVKVGRAIGTKNAVCGWAKDVLGLKPNKYVSHAKSFKTRVYNNLHLDTSPFNLKAGFKEMVDDFKFKKGNGINAAASWVGLGVDLYSNYQSNKEEQEENGMSNGRVIAETVIETGVDMVLQVGAKAVVGAVVAAVLPVSAPALLVTAASAALVSVVNVGVKSLTGRSVTEWVTDGVVEGGKAIAKAATAVGKSVKATATKVASAVSDGVKNIGNKIGNAFKGISKIKWGRVFA